MDRRRERLLDRHERADRKRCGDHRNSGKLHRAAAEPAVIMVARPLAALDLRPAFRRQLQRWRLTDRQDLIDRDPIFGPKAGARAFAPDDRADDYAAAMPKLDDASLSPAGHGRID